MIHWRIIHVFLFLVIVLVVAGCISTDLHETEAYKGWNLTLVCDGQESHLTLADLKKMPSFSGHGYLVSTTGIKYGPFRGVGIPLTEFAQIRDMNDSDRLFLYGSDEYLWVLDKDQVLGKDYITFDQNLTEIRDQHVTPVLMYEQDGKQVSQDDGGPIRLALLTDRQGVITEGSGWVKWISRIEIHR